MASKKIKINCECQHSLTVEQLQAFQGKLKSIDSESFDKLKASIVKYGFSFPIFVWNDQILDGHQRLAAVKKLMEDGYTLKADLLPVVPIQAKDRKEAAEKLLLINSRYAKIEQEGFDFFVEDFDLDIADLSDILDIPEIDFSFEEEEFEGNTDPDDVPEVEETPVTKMGDIWLLGSHRLMCGDSTKIDDVEKLMNGEKADMVFTDPPYLATTGGGFNPKTSWNMGGYFSHKNFDDNQHSKLFETPKFEDWMKLIDKVLKVDSEILIMSNNNYLVEFINLLKSIKAKMHNILIMHKDTSMPNRWYSANHEFILYFYFGKAAELINKMQNTVITVRMPKYKDKYHPTQKPVELLTSIFKNHPHKLIYEPFSGSGTTIIAAQQTGRKCYAMEISPQYVQVAIKRWQDFTGEDAVLERTGETFEEIKNA